MTADRASGNSCAEKTFVEESKNVLYSPFSIENMSGKILAKESVTCNIKFSPMDVKEYTAAVAIE